MSFYCHSTFDVRKRYERDQVGTEETFASGSSVVATLCAARQ